MPDIYLIIVVLLFVLAITDLIVGVSNDAVNFLNSAIGSRVAPRHIIMIVASAGIFVGATFSSGMMEVARKGIFNPEIFFFTEIMILFLAVMLTDIILLDFFNTVGLPTSTTVSIVFELLGAAVVLSLIKISIANDSISTLGEYINSSQAVLIISGIFLSIVFAFLLGALVQLLSRLLFSFEYEKQNKLVGALWSAIALAAMTYFLLLKGIKGASFVTDSFISQIQQNGWLIILASIGFWTILLYILARFRINIFRIVVLFGTFALAMAFAGNDLVNFIGVPIAGFESYLAWSASNSDPLTYSMEVLQEPVRTKSYLLMLAGLVMITTLWFSKKARSVTETEVSLGRQTDGYERFTPNRLAQEIVRYSSAIGIQLQRIIPASWIAESEQKFTIHQSEALQADRPAFDLIRASVNLTMASILIAFATSLKLPLSTTYVSFMVAMGTSLSDKAWGRDSAVFRVAGVLNVIGGWFATAFIAFCVAGLFAFLIYQFNEWAILILIVLAISLIIRSFRYHKTIEKKKIARKKQDTQYETIVFDHLLNRINSRITKILQVIAQIYEDAILGLLEEDRDRLDRAKTLIKKLKELNDDLEYELYGSMKRIDETDVKSGRIMLDVFDWEQNVIQSLRLINKTCTSHVKNVLKPVKNIQRERLLLLQVEMDHFIKDIVLYVQENGLGRLEQITSRQLAIRNTIKDFLHYQVQGIKSKKFSARNSQLIFKLLLESKDLVKSMRGIVDVYEVIQERSLSSAATT